MIVLLRMAIMVALIEYRIYNDGAVSTGVWERSESVIVNPINRLIIGKTLVLLEPIHHFLIVIHGSVVVANADQSTVVAVIGKYNYVLIAQAA